MDLFPDLTVERDKTPGSRISLQRRLEDVNALFELAGSTRSNSSGHRFFDRLLARDICQQRRRILIPGFITECSGGCFFRRIKALLRQMSSSSGHEVTGNLYAELGV